MALTFGAIEALGSGARFVRADLHVHSKASYDVNQDSGMTPAAIIDAAVDAGIEILAITDHNTVEAIPESIEHALRYAGKLLFIPGIELTANEGHVLVYFDPEEYRRLEQLRHQLDIVHDEQGSRVRASMIDVIRTATAVGGLCVAAHIDTEIGFEIGNPGFPAWKKDLLLEEGLRGLEFRDPGHHLWYSIDDPSTTDEGNERRKYAQARVDAGLRPRGQLARFHNSDAHSLDELIPPKALNRIKVSSLTFAAFRSALADPEARVRINELVPKSIPRVVGVGINGGFLDGTSIHFANNLNIFFGGRGTGKSTALRAVAFALDRATFSAADAPFQSVTVFCEDANGVDYRFDRTAGGAVIGRLRKDGNVMPSVTPSEFPVEYYGQGELGRVAQGSLTDPLSLQQFLDRHIAFAGLQERESSIRDEAEELIAQLAPLIVVQRGRNALEEQLQSLEERLKASEGTKIKQVAEFNNRLTAERTLRASYLSVAGQYRRGVSLKSLMRETGELRGLSRVESFGKTTSEPFRTIEAAINEANAFLVAKARELNEYLQRAAETINREAMEIEKSHARGDEQVQEYVDQLKEKGLASSIAELNDLSRKKAALVAQIAKINAQRAEHDELVIRFRECTSDLQAVRSSIATLRGSQKTELNEGFNRDKYGRLDVLLVPDDRFSAPEYTAFISDKLVGSWYQSEALPRLVDSLAPTDLADLLDAQDMAGLGNVDAIGAKWAPTFLEKLGDPNSTLRLRTFERLKPPRFKVIDRATRATVPFSHLSDGQKHTVMLTIALLAGSRYPLIIDQPEDDLDNLFIAERLVRTLRDVKEGRQVILVTHNANIAVLGDSEQLLAMAHENGSGKISSRGSIDDPTSQLAVQNCLEGGVDALRRRVDIYGI